eukprot:254006-Rhodomonas_salina.1
MSSQCAARCRVRGLCYAMSAIRLRAPYGMSGTDVWYRGTKGGDGGQAPQRAVRGVHGHVQAFAGLPARPVLLQRAQGRLHTCTRALHTLAHAHTRVHTS